MILNIHKEANFFLYFFVCLILSVCFCIDLFCVCFFFLLFNYLFTYIYFLFIFYLFFISLCNIIEFSEVKQS